MNCQAIFQSCNHFTFSPAISEVSSFSTSLPTLVFSLILAILVVWNSRSLWFYLQLPKELLNIFFMCLLATYVCTLFNQIISKRASQKKLHRWSLKSSDKLWKVLQHKVSSALLTPPALCSCPLALLSGPLDPSPAWVECPDSLWVRMCICSSAAWFYACWPSVCLL